MRAINKFVYKNKHFLCGDLTVGDYILSIQDFDHFLEKILSEFNKEIPKLDQAFLKAFLDILFDRKDDLKIFKDKKAATPEDFHIILGFYMRTMHQGYLDTCSMPLKLFNRMLDDMELIIDPSKYDPKRNDTSPDRQKIKETFGGKTEIK